METFNEYIYRKNMDTLIQSIDEMHNNIELINVTQINESLASNVGKLAMIASLAMPAFSFNAVKDTKDTPSCSVNQVNDLHKQYNTLVAKHNTVGHLINSNDNAEDILKSVDDFKNAVHDFYVSANKFVNQSKCAKNPQIKVKLQKIIDFVDKLDREIVTESSNDSTNKIIFNSQSKELWVTYSQGSGQTAQFPDFKTFITNKKDDHFDSLTDKIVKWSNQNKPLIEKGNSKLFEIPVYGSGNRMYSIWGGDLEPESTIFMVVNSNPTISVVNLFKTKNEAKSFM